MTQWDQVLAQKYIGLPSLVSTAKTFYASYGGLLTKYKGGMPARLLAAIAAIESSGKMVAGDPSLGEFGFFQVATQTEKDFGVPSGLRLRAEGNIFLASLEYNAEAARLALRYPAYVKPGSKGQWHLARLVFAIGRHGADVCIQAAIAGGYMGPGQGFEGVVKWADATGGVAIGGSEAGKIWYRVKLIELTQRVADALGFEGAGVPLSPPAPPGVAYTVPKDVASALPKAAAAGGLLLVAVAAIALYLWA